MSSSPSAIVIVPVVRPSYLRLEYLAILASVAAVGMIWWMGGAAAGLRTQPALCAPGPQVTQAQVTDASDRLRAAALKARYTAMNGSEYAAAKIGLPLSGPEHGLAVKAAGELTVVREELARLCAQPTG